MENRKKNIDETWNSVIRSMTKDELRQIVYKHDSYSSKVVTWAKEALKQKYGLTDEDIQSILLPEHHIVENPMTRDFLIEMLREMGCDVSFENDDLEDDGICDISFSYMTKTFYANANNESTFVCIDKYCSSCKIEDEEEVARVKEAINIVNDRKRVKMYYLKDEESKRLYISCCDTFQLFPLIPNVELFLHTQLKTILNVEKYYCNILEDLNARKNRYENRVENCKLRMKKERQCKENGAITIAEQNNMNKIAGSRDLFLDTLTKISCPYQIDEEDNSICFEYHGDTFYAEADNEQSYITIYYYSWGEVDLEDIEDIGETAAIRKAINEANWKNRVMTVFTIDEEEKIMNVHGKSEILFIPEIPNLENYLITELSRFFRAEYSVRAELF